MGEQGVELRRRAGAETSLKDFRKDVIIDLFNEAGQKVISYRVFRCWVSEYQALPDLDANANAIAIQHIKLENEGWERDLEWSSPPSRPSRSRPARRRSVAAAITVSVPGGQWVDGVRYRDVEIRRAPAREELLLAEGGADDRRLVGGAAHLGAVEMRRPARPGPAVT